MMKLISLALAAVLALGLLAGCRAPADDTDSGTQKPTGGNMLPGEEDRVDPTNGANRDPSTGTTPSGGTDGDMGGTHGGTAPETPNSRGRRMPFLQ